MFIASEFVTLEQFSNTDGQGFDDLVTFRYAITSLIQALVITSFHLRNISELALQIPIIRSYALAFSIICITKVLQLSGKISVIPQPVSMGLITIFSFAPWRSLPEQNVVT